MIHTVNKTLDPRRIVRLFAGGALLLAVTACASTPMPPSKELQAALLAINGAEQERATEFAPQDMKRAHDKLGEANAAVAQEEMDKALLLALESRVSAELASAKSSESKAKAINDEMLQSIETLQQELSRNSGIRQ